jgi:hypothetical protein
VINLHNQSIVDANRLNRNDRFALSVLDRANGGGPKKAGDIDEKRVVGNVSSDAKSSENDEHKLYRIPVRERAYRRPKP